MPKKHDFKKFPELTNSQMDKLYFESPHKQITEDFTAKVEKVIDGDTIKLKWDERDFEFRLRISRIAAPEIKEKGGIEARDYLKKRIEGKIVDIEIDLKNRVGKWGRLIGRIIFQGSNIGEEMIDMGHAIPIEDRELKPIPEINNLLDKIWESQ